MSLAPLTDAPVLIQIHLLFAVPAILLGPVVLFRRRRDGWHRRLGRVALISVVGLALTGLAIPSDIAVIWHMGPIHLFSAFALWGVGEGLWHIRHGRWRAHAATMRSLWFGAVGLAGLFTLIPGRRINQAVFGAPSDWGWLVIALGVAGLVALARRTRAAALRPQRPLGPRGPLRQDGRRDFGLEKPPTLR